MKYLVQWSIEVDEAESPEEAAQFAFDHMRSPDSTEATLSVIGLEYGEYGKRGDHTVRESSGE